MVSGVVAQKLQALDRALAELRSVGRLTPNDLADDWRLQRAVERAALILVDVAVEVCQHVAGAAGKTRLPSSGDAIALCAPGALSISLTTCAWFGWPASVYRRNIGRTAGRAANEQLTTLRGFGMDRGLPGSH
jgi:hypothetical protein